MIKELEQTIRRLIDPNSSSEEMQIWIYGQPDFESEIGAEEYDNLLNINFASVRGVREAKQVLRAFHVGRWPGVLERHEIIALCDSVLGGLISVQEGYRRLSDIGIRSDILGGHLWAIEDELDAGANVGNILAHIRDLRTSLA